MRKNNILHLAKKYLCFSIPLFLLILFSQKSHAQDACIETISKIQKFQKRIPVPAAEIVVEEMTFWIDQLKADYAKLPDTCKYWLGSALQWRADAGYTKLGFEEKGLADCEFGLTAFNSIDDKSKYRKEKAYLYNTIGLYYKDLRNYDKSKFYLEKAEKEFSILAEKDPSLMKDANNALASLGMLFYDSGELYKCFEYSEKALQARIDFKNSSNGALIENILIANSYYGMAQAYQLKAELEEHKSLEYYQNYDSVFHYMKLSTDLLEENSFIMFYVADKEEILIKLFVRTGIWLNEVYPEKIAEAQHYYDKAKPLFDNITPMSLGKSYIFQSMMDMNKGELNQSLESIQLALTTLNIDFKPQDVYQNPSLHQAAILEKSILLSALNQKALVLKKRYEAEKEIKDLKTSLNTSLLSINLIDTIQHNFPYDFSAEIMQDKYSHTYTDALVVANELSEVTKESKYFETAFYLAEKSKSFTLRRSHKKKIIRENLSKNSPQRKLLEEELIYLGKIAEFEKRYTKTFEKDSTTAMLYLDSVAVFRELHFNLQDQIEEKYPNLYDSQFDQKVITVQEIQDKLDDQTAIIEYAVSDKDLFTFVITNDNKTSQLIKQDGINEWGHILDSCLVFLKTGNHQLYKGADASAKELYDILLKNALTDLPENINRLIIIPDDRLRNLPFEILIEKEVGDINYRDYPYLLKKYMVSYDFSVTTRNQSNQKKISHNFENDICAFGADYLIAKGEEDVLRRCSNFNLAGPAKVVDYINNNFSNSFTKKNTTRDFFFNHHAQGKILYLGLHGCLDEDNPLLSNILFTQTSDTLGSELSIAEIYNIDFKSEHVFLTACYAGSGRLRKGEGIISLARAFYYAGCNSLTTSLYEVEDDAAVDLEVAYLKYLSQPKISKDQALQLAKIEVLDSYNEHPQLWANFILIGNTAPVFFEKP